MKNAKKIDIKSWGRRDHYAWFNSISAPCYGADVRLDVTKLVERCRSRGESFFINMLYIATEALNEIEEFRMRNVAGQPYIFDSVNPSCCIMTNSGYYVNRRIPRAPYGEFYANARRIIDEAKTDTRMEADGDKAEILDDLYFSCTPWMDFVSITQPIPYNSPDNATIPRSAWGKYVEENGRFRMTMNITVHHAFIDGKPLSLAFNRIQEKLNTLEF